MNAPGRRRIRSHPDGDSRDNRIEDLHSFLDVLNVNKAIRMGHSAAGDELTAFTTKYPSRVAALVYFDAAYDRADPQMPKPRREAWQKVAAQLSGGSLKTSPAIPGGPPKGPPQLVSLRVRCRVESSVGRKSSRNNCGERRWHPQPADTVVGSASDPLRKSAGTSRSRPHPGSGAASIRAWPPGRPVRQNRPSPARGHSKRRERLRSLLQPLSSTWPDEESCFQKRSVDSGKTLFLSAEAGNHCDSRQEMGLVTGTGWMDLKSAPDTNTITMTNFLYGRR